MAFSSCICLGERVFVCVFAGVQLSVSESVLACVLGCPSSIGPLNCTTFHEGAQGCERGWECQGENAITQTVIDVDSDQKKKKKNTWKNLYLKI